MNSHSNARTNAYSRAIIIQRYQSGEPQQVIADALGVSRRTICKWIARHKDNPDIGLHDRSSRPKRFPNQLAQACVEAIVHLRKTFLMNAFAIARHLGLAYSPCVDTSNITASLATVISCLRLKSSAMSIKCLGI